MFEKDKSIMSGSGEFNENEHPRDSDGKFINKNSGQAKLTVNQLSQQINDVLSGNYKDRHITLSQETPKILQNIGIPNKPLLMTKRHAYLAVNKDGIYKRKDDHYHNLGKDLFINIPSFLKSPILVFQSNDDSRDIIAVINAVDKNNNPIIVPVRINGKGNQNFIEIDANIAKSAYGRNNINDFIKKHVTKNNLLLVENKKIRNYKP